MFTYKTSAYYGSWSIKMKLCQKHIGLIYMPSGSTMGV